MSEAPTMSRPVLAETRGADGRLPEEPEGPERRASGPWLSVVLMGLLALAAFAAIVRVSLGSLRGSELDNDMMHAVGNSATAAMKVTDWITYVSVGGVALCLAVCVGVALMRRRVGLAVAAMVLVAGANVTTRILKLNVLDRADGAGNSLPSGHATVALSLGLAAVLVAPAAWRWVVVPFAGFVATFVGAGTVVGQWHRPGDVLAAVAVCLGWTALAVGLAALIQPGAAPRRPGWAARSSLALVGSAVVGLIFVGWGLRPADHDVNLVLAVLALVPIGIASAAALAWTSAVADRHLA